MDIKENESIYLSLIGEFYKYQKLRVYTRISLTKYFPIMERLNELGEGFKLMISEAVRFAKSLMETKEFITTFEIPEEELLDEILRFYVLTYCFKEEIFLTYSLFVASLENENDELLTEIIGKYVRKKEGLYKELFNLSVSTFTKRFSLILYNLLKFYIKSNRKVKIGVFLNEGDPFISKMARELQGLDGVELNPFEPNKSFDYLVYSSRNPIGNEEKSDFYEVIDHSPREITNIKNDVLRLMVK